MLHALFAAWALFLPAVVPAAARDAARDPLAEDARLTQQVAVTAEGLAVAELLALLAAKSGVALAAGDETADDKVLLFGPPRPLREIMGDLAALFNDRWTRKQAADGSRRYVLTRDLRARQYEDRLARAATGRMLARLEEHVRALEETPEQLARRPQKDTIRILTEPIARLATTVYAALSPEQREALFVRGRLAIPYAALAPRYQEPLRKAYAERLALEQEGARQLREKNPGARILLHTPEELERGTVRFRAQRVGGYVSVGMGLGLLPLSAEVKQEETGQPSYSYSGWPIALLDSRTGWLLPPRGDPYTGEAVPENARLPKAEAIRAAAAVEAWPERLRRFAAAAKVPVMADFYRGKPVARPVDPPENAPSSGTPAAALDALCRPSGYLWWTRGQTLLLRKRDWYDQRRYEVPDRWLRAQVERLGSRGGVPTVADVLRVLDLTPEQIAGLNALATASYAYDDDTLAGARELLAIVNVSPRSKSAPLPLTAAGPGARPERAPAYDTRSPLARALLPAFLEALDLPVSPAGAAGFRARLFRPFDRPQTAGSGYRHVPVRMEWSLEAEDDRRGFTLFLPASLPLGEIGPVQPLQVWSLHTTDRSTRDPEGQQHHLALEGRQRSASSSEEPQVERRRRPAVPQFRSTNRESRVARGRQACSQAEGDPDGAQRS